MKHYNNKRCCIIGSIIVFFLLLVGNTSFSQTLIDPTDTTDAYLLPRRFTSTGPIASLHHHRRGNGFPVQKEGTVLYGIGCIQPFELPKDGEAYVWLYKWVNGSVVPVDSINICNAVSNSSVVVPVFLPYHGATTGYDTLPILEFYFDTAYPVDDTDFYLCWGTSRLWYGDGNMYYIEGEVIHATDYPNDFWADSSMRSFQCNGNPAALQISSYPSYFFYGIFPIIEETPRYRHERLSTCGGIGKTSVDYTATRIHTIHWTDTVGHCLYQVAIGPANRPFSEYELFETTDTVLNYIWHEYGEKKAFRVRAKCCVDTFTTWRPWSDTVQFVCPYYKLSLFSNDLSLGIVNGYGRFDPNQLVGFIADPKQGCTFDHWNDGDTTNPRQITIVCDTSFTAFFSRIPNTDSDTTEGIETLVERYTYLMPNPASGQVSVMSSFRIDRVEIYTLAGQRILQENAAGLSAQIDISALAQGTYIVRTYTNRGVSNKRLVVR